MFIFKSFAGTLLAAVVLTGPAAAAIDEPAVERTADGKLLVRWASSHPVDVYIAAQPGASMADAKLISDDDGDGSHLTAATNTTRPYFILKDVTDGSVRPVAERLLPLEQGSNFRDVGGYPAAGGKHVRWGLIYRSGATPLLTDQDVDYVERLGIKAMIDLRSTEERQLAPTRLAGRGIRYIASDYPSNTIFARLQPGSAGATAAVSKSIYRDWPLSLAPQYRAIFEELLTRRGPISYNCSAGQDRTGVATALVLTALGVPREIILQDYHLSTTYRRPENEMPEIDPAKHPNNPVAQYYGKVRQQPGALKPRPLYLADGRPQLAEAFDEIEGRWGSVENYLHQVLDVSPTELALLRANYLE